MTIRWMLSSLVSRYIVQIFSTEYSQALSQGPQDKILQLRLKPKSKPLNARFERLLNVLSIQLYYIIYYCNFMYITVSFGHFKYLHFLVFFGQDTDMIYENQMPLNARFEWQSDFLCNISTL